jgi:cytochrome c oxidase cbb3-type subunit 3
VAPPSAARLRWLLIILGPSAFLLIGTVLALVFLPHPVPRTATAAQRLYLTYCAECHGADGRGSWRAALFLLRPGNLARPGTLAGLSDKYLLDLVRDGGAPIGKPGMPAFGYHLTDDQIRAVVEYVRTLSRPRAEEASRSGR